MLLILLLVIPLLTGLVSFLLKDPKAVKAWSIFGALVTLIVASWAFCGIKEAHALKVDVQWLPALGANFSLEATAGTLLMTLLTAMAFVLVYLAQWNKPIEHSSRFFALMGLSASGLMGVFFSQRSAVILFLLGTGFDPGIFPGRTMGWERPD
jgi:NADH:ubiquinone oxidoreductase subunit 4 (chain M)